jgi:hypothetical protein
MFMWTLDKLINPKHATAVFEAFYGLKGMGATVMYSLATAEMALILGFVAGYKKKWTYGAVLALHAISTLSSYKQYLDPFAPSRLFCVVLSPGFGHAVEPGQAFAITPVCKEWPSAATKHQGTGGCSLRQRGAGHECRYISCYSVGVDRGWIVCRYGVWHGHPENDIRRRAQSNP